MTPKTFAHFGNSGDVLAATPALRQFYRSTNIKPILYLIQDYPASYYKGAVHPVTDSLGNMVSLNEGMINMLIPLLKAQNYLEDVRSMTAQQIEANPTLIDINLSEIRNTFCNIPYGDIRRWYFHVYPDLVCNLAEQYLFVPDSEIDLAKNKIIITRSERYLNPQVKYNFLKEYENNLLFVGTEIEYHIFRLRNELNIERLIVNDFLELAQALKQSKGHISNQTMAFQISEGMKLTRAVELCSDAPNVIPTGENAFDFYAQKGLEFYFHVMNGTLGEWAKKQKTPANASVDLKTLTPLNLGVK